MSDDRAGAIAPVTVIVRRQVAAGRGPEFEEWVTEMQAASARFSGYLGTDVIRPAAGAAQAEYALIFRFASYAQLQAWESSDALREGLGRAAAFTVGTPQVEQLTGLEAWFTAAGAAATAAPRWKMLIVLCLAIYPVSNLLGLLIGPLLAGLPMYLATLITLPLSLALVSYLVLPWLTPRLARWLYAKTPPKQA